MADRSIAPPNLTAGLRQFQKERYPAADPVVISEAALIIAAQVDFLLRSRRAIKVKGKPRHWPNRHIREDECHVTWLSPRRRSVANELRALGRAAESKSEWAWAKAWHEVSPDVIGLLEEIAGPEGIFPPLLPDWGRGIEKLAAKHDLQIVESDVSTASIFAQNLFGAPIPSPRTIAPLILEAIRRAARPGRPANWRRDMVVAEIGRQYKRLTGEQPRQASKAGLSFRSGGFTAFLDALETLYADHLPREFLPAPKTKPVEFGVQKSGRNISRIFRGASR